MSTQELEGNDFEIKTEEIEETEESVESANVSESEELEQREREEASAMQAEQTVEQKEQPVEKDSQQMFCTNCGKPIEKENAFCPFCGKKVGARKTGGVKPNKKMVIGLVVAILAVAVFAIIKTGGPDSIELKYENATIEEGGIGVLDYTILPEKMDTEDIQLKWTSSDPSVITVSEDGTLSACSVGTATITVETKNGKKDECEITVTEAKPNLKSVFDLFCDEEWASVAADGSYLAIDTKPEYSYGKYEDEAIQGIYLVHSALGIPDSVIQKMGKTTALAGIQTSTHGDIEISWSYHPDNGLEVIYEVVD